MVAIRALAHVGPAAAPAMPSLRKLAASKDAFIRAGVITACIRIGGPVAAEVLAGCVQDPNPVNAEMASEALKKLKKK